ncbi:MAG: hypothetical protein HWQ43_17205, partial [Nostoc sp. JL31]|nr:hypothetical protein [Nostoc sp. JL31]
MGVRFVSNAPLPRNSGADCFGHNPRRWVISTVSATVSGSPRFHEARSLAAGGYAIATI